VDSEDLKCIVVIDATGPRARTSSSGGGRPVEGELLDDRRARYPLSRASAHPDYRDVDLLLDCIQPVRLCAAGDEESPPRDLRHGS